MKITAHSALHHRFLFQIVQQYLHSGIASEGTVMKTELVAKWVSVDGRLELQWAVKEENQVIYLNRCLSQTAKAA
jgi:hypothetical protein